MLVLPHEILKLDYFSSFFAFTLPGIHLRFIANMGTGRYSKDTRNSIYLALLFILIISICNLQSVQKRKRNLIPNADYLPHCTKTMIVMITNKEGVALYSLNLQSNWLISQALLQILKQSNHIIENVGLSN